MPDRVRRTRKEPISIIHQFFLSVHATSVKYMLPVLIQLLPYLLYSVQESKCQDSNPSNQNPAISHEFVSFSQEWLECVALLGTKSWKLSCALVPLGPSRPGRVNVPEGWQSRSGSAWSGQLEKGGTVSKQRPYSCLPTSSSSSRPS